MTGRGERLASSSGRSPGPVRGALGSAPYPGSGRRIRLTLHLDDDLAVDGFAYDVHDERGDLVVISAPPPFPFGATLEQACREFRRHYVNLPRELRLPLR